MFQTWLSVDTHSRERAVSAHTASNMLYISFMVAIPSYIIQVGCELTCCQFPRPPPNSVSHTHVTSTKAGILLTLLIALFLEPQTRLGPEQELNEHLLLSE